MSTTKRIGLAVCLVGCFSAVGAQAQTDTEAMLILKQNARDAGGSQLIMLSGPDDAVIRSLDELESRIVLVPPGEDDMLPASATAVISITTPGSYVLGGNVIGVAGKHGIEILKSNVTLDLNGFALIGTPEAKSGVHAPQHLTNITIADGAIRGWPEHGVSGGQMSASVVRDVLVGDCGGAGIQLGQGAVTNCIARRNGDDGIAMVSGKGLIKDCSVERNGGDGIDCAKYAVISNVVATNNHLNGIRSTVGAAISACSVFGSGQMGIQTGANSMISGCTVTETRTEGIKVGSNCSITGCVVKDSGFTGLVTNDNATVSGCSFIDSGGNGVGARQNCTVTNCTASGNAYYGFSLREGGLLEGCVANDNMWGGGISVGDGGRVAGCTIRGHNEENTVGIKASSGCVIEDCALDSNTIGILVLESDNRIKGNNITLAGTAIQALKSGNFIVRNTVSATVGFDVAPGKTMGAIATDPAAAGPWDNFEF